MLIDRDDSVWASSALGLYRLRDRRTFVYRSQTMRPETAVVTEIIVPSLPESPVGALYQDRRGRVWLGMAAGLGNFPGTRFVRVTNAPAGFVDAITEDTQGNVWIANRDAGLLRISIDGAVETFAWASLTMGLPLGLARGAGPGAGRRVARVSRRARRVFPRR